MLYEDWEARQIRNEKARKVKAEALAAEAAAVFNLGEIRKLERRIRHLEAAVFPEGPPPTRKDVGAFGYE